MADYLGVDEGLHPDAILFIFTAEAKKWCKERRLDLHIQPLSLAHLGLAKINGLQYPELSSRIKASRTRNLLAFVTHFAVAIAPRSYSIFYSMYINNPAARMLRCKSSFSYKPWLPGG